MPNVVKQFRFCPRCGSKLRILRKKKFDICVKCGFEMYDSVLSVATTIIVNGDGDILLTKRKKDPHKGFWGTPGGFSDRGEGAEDTARREVREELGLRLGVIVPFDTYPLFYKYRNIQIACAESTFLAHVSGRPRLLARDDISEARFFKPENIPFARLAFPSHRKAIRAYLAERRRLRR
jgi:ADP-ribose pyrophosphatase YjhB (NUDIX family)